MGPSPFNVPPPPPPPPRPNSSASDANKGDNGSNKESRSGSVDLSTGPGSDAVGSPPPQMMGRGHGDGRFPGRYNDYRGGGFQGGRARYNDQYQGRGGFHGGGRGFRGGYGRGPPPNQGWVSCLNSYEYRALSLPL